MNKETNFLTTKWICLIATLTIILVLQEYALSFLPNIQLTMLLMFLYTRTIGLKRNMVIIGIYVFLDNLIFGSFNPLIIAFQLLAWFIVSFLISRISKKFNNNIILAIFGIFFSLVYSWVMIIPGMIVFEFTFFEYLLGDFVFEILMSVSSFVSILLLLSPIEKKFKILFQKLIF